MLELLVDHHKAALALGLLSLIILRVIWEDHLRPALFSREEIARLADELRADYGEEAEHIAFCREDRARWRCKHPEAGMWRRVRAELRRTTPGGRPASRFSSADK